MTEKHHETSTDAPRPRGRPRKSPDEQSTRKELIRAGLVCLTERGYADVSIEDILTASGAAKGSFYHHFASKAEYGTELILAYDAYFVGKLNRWLTNEALTPLDRLHGFIGDAQAGMARHEFRRGCLVGNLSQERASLTPDMRERLITVLNGWQRLTEACLRKAQSQRQISTHHDAEALARFFWIGWEGAVMRAKLEGHAGPLRDFAAGFFTLISPS